MAGSMGTTRRYRREAKAEPSQSVADWYKAQLGYIPSTRPFTTTANVKCGRCLEIKSGCEFEQPLIPGRMCVCASCSTKPKATK